MKFLLFRQCEGAWGLVMFMPLIKLQTVTINHYWTRSWKPPDGKDALENYLILAHSRSGDLCTIHTYFQIKESLPSAFLFCSLLWSVSKYHYHHTYKIQTTHSHNWNFWKSATMIDLQKHLAVREVCSGKDLQNFQLRSKLHVSSGTRMLEVFVRHLAWTLEALRWSNNIPHTKTSIKYSRYLFASWQMKHIVVQKEDRRDGIDCLPVLPY